MFWLKKPALKIAVLSVVLLSSCAPIRFGGRNGAFPDQRSREDELPSPESIELRKRIAEDAATFLGRKYIKVEKRHFRSDCSGLVQAVYYKNGIDILDPNGTIKSSNVKNIFDYVQAKGRIFTEKRPKPGDIVFFSNTRATKGSGYLSHIGIVENVSKDGTISFIHKSSLGIIRNHMNLKQPSIRKSTDDDTVINSYMRRRRAGDRPGTKYLAGDLFEAFGNIIDPTSSVKDLYPARAITPKATPAPSQSTEPEVVEPEKPVTPEEPAKQSEPEIEEKETLTPQTVEPEKAIEEAPVVEEQ
jgi:peptidoglycan DL-endopeptidase CwlO